MPIDRFMAVADSLLIGNNFFYKNNAVDLTTAKNSLLDEIVALRARHENEVRELCGIHQGALQSLETQLRVETEELLNGG